MIQDPVLATFCDTFNKLDNTCTEKLYSIYSSDIVFIDPLHRVEGIEALKRDFDALYAKNISKICNNPARATSRSRVRGGAKAGAF